GGGGRAAHLPEPVPTRDVPKPARELPQQPRPLRGGGTPPPPQLRDPGRQARAEGLAHAGNRGRARQALRSLGQAPASGVVARENGFREGTVALPPPRSRRGRR